MSDAFDRAILTTFLGNGTSESKFHRRTLKHHALFVVA